MALFDCATVKRIDTSYRTPMVSYRGLIVHIAVSNALFPSYLPGTKADFYIRKNGVICQEIDTAFRSGAHLNGNADYLSVELEGGLDPGDLHAAMPRAQLEALGRLMAEANRRHGTPLRLMTDTNPRADSSRGLGYHRLGVPYRGVYATKTLTQVRPGWLQSPTHMWFSKSQGKECPGDGRIAQLPEALDLAKGINTTPTPSEEDTMSPAQEKALYTRLDTIVEWMDVNFKAQAQAAELNRNLLAGWTRDQTKAAVAASTAAVIAEIPNLNADQIEARVASAIDKALDGKSLPVSGEITVAVPALPLGTKG